MAGALIYGATYQSMQPSIMQIANVGETTLPSLLNVDLWLSILFFVLLSLTMFYFLERYGQLRRDKLAEPEGHDLEAKPL